LPKNLPILVKNEESYTNLLIYGKTIILDKVKREIWVIIERDFSISMVLLKQIVKFLEQKKEDFL